MLHARCNLPTDETQGVHAEVLVALHLVVEGVWAPALCEKDNADLEQRKLGRKERWTTAQQRATLACADATKERGVLCVQSCRAEGRSSQWRS